MLDSAHSKPSRPSDQLADEQIFERFRAGDLDAFAEIDRRFRRPLMLMALRVLGHRQDAEDVTQQTFLAVIAKAGLFDDTRRLAPWIRTIQSNLLTDFLRKSGRRRRRGVRVELTEDIAAEEHSPLDQLLQREQTGQLHEAISQLAAVQRRALQKVCLGQTHVDRVAQLEKVSSSVIRHRLLRARKRLRDQLKPDRA